MPKKPPNSETRRNTDEIRANLLARLRDINDQMSAEISDLKELSNSDACDAALGTAETELASKLAEHGSNEAAQIKFALQQLDRGRYGICENCPKTIAPSRLEALPYCALCIDCQRLAEAGTTNSDDLRSKWADTDARDDEEPPSVRLSGRC